MGKIFIFIVFRLLENAFAKLSISFIMGSLIPTCRTTSTQETEFGNKNSFANNPGITSKTARRRLKDFWVLWSMLVNLQRNYQTCSCNFFNLPLIIVVVFFSIVRFILFFFYILLAIASETVKNVRVPGGVKLFFLNRT